MPERDHTERRKFDMNPNMHPMRIARLVHDNRCLREIMRLIVDSAEGNTTANILPSIARIARSALVAGFPHNPALLDPTHLHGAKKLKPKITFRCLDGMTVLQCAIAQTNEDRRLISAIEDQGSLQPWQQDRIVELEPGAFGWWLHYRHGKGIDLGDVSCAQALMSFNLRVVHALP